MMFKVGDKVKVSGNDLIGITGRIGIILQKVRSWWTVDLGDKGYWDILESDLTLLTEPKNPETLPPKPEKIERCKYATKKIVPGFHRTIKARRYSATLKEQCASAAEPLIQEAKRKLREVPLCSITGEPVTLGYTFDITDVDQYLVRVVFICSTCGDRTW